MITYLENCGEIPNRFFNRKKFKQYQNCVKNTDVLNKDFAKLEKAKKKEEEESKDFNSKIAIIVGSFLLFISLVFMK